ncbi:cd109 antigen-like protein [Dermatophagoides farinae]|uniref:TEP1-F n=1 Tax=Dermatophagoides farinae TaxID=6954 RepID=A0A9D4NSY6_DERFA|nr:CD109 antigen-like isoform X2 [Dermatophagoides farinae]KAH7637287.1 cd109 antigen-like protein [Dermatophagoides farinae]
MWAHFIFVILIFLSILKPYASDPVYTVVAPSKLRPNSDYHLSIQLENTTQSASFDVSISGPSTQSNFNRIDTTVIVRPYESRILNLEIGEWAKGNYKLIIKGRTDGEPRYEFANETDLEFDSKSYSIFVQTDKAVYKPGQTVRFRAIIVNPSLIPNLAGSLDIFIKDPKDNLIKQWKRIFTHRGVVSEQFALSDQPPLGDWTIIVEVAGGQKSEKKFSVAEYVLPTFSVDVLLPPYATYNRSDVVATVKATYTYGKPVRGDATLTVQPRIRHAAISFRPLEQYQTKLRLEADGKVDIPVNIVRDLNLKSDFFEREIEFFALVEETLTGRKYNKSSVMKIYHKEVKVEMIKTSKTFKPGLKYTAFLKVAYQDDTPVDNDGPPVILRYGYSYNENHWNNTIEKVPYNGITQIDLYPPKDTEKIGVIGLRAEFRGQTYFLESINMAQSPSMNFIQVIQKQQDQEDSSIFNQKPVRVGDEITFIVNATEPFDNLVYEVMAKGDLVLARNVRSIRRRTTEQIVITINHRMTPRARLLVYYIRDENKEIVADSLSFNVDGTFKTPVSISSNVNQTKPGGMVDIQVRTKPSAYVGLLGVDQSVLLLKSGFDITQQDVLNELESYDSGSRQSNGGYYPWARYWLWSGATTAAEIFADSGVVILTNSLVHRYEHKIYFAMPMAASASFTRLGSANFESSNNMGESEELIMADRVFKKSSTNPSRKSKSVTKLRKKFPETWIWSNLTSDNDGVARYSDSIPDTITSWYVSAFAVDSITGLGIAPDTLKINVFRPFFIKLSLPYSIIRGESVSIQAIVFNYQNKPVKAEVVMENPADEFEFTNAANEIEFAGEQNILEKRKSVTIAPFDGVSVTFLITPKKLGFINIRIRASSDMAGDAVVQKLLVKPEGQTQYFNKAMFINAVNQQDRTLIKRNISVEIPPNAVPGSVRVMVSGISDILGPTVNHLDDLLRMPYGCGEQNMINLVPNIVVTNYLERVNRMTDPIRSKTKNHIETGYQRELTYRRDDGSFSAFGQSDKAGSTWLTAFVAKTFIQARPHIDVDNAVITKSIEWLLTRQRKDGSFAEYGEVHNKALQGGSAIKPKAVDGSDETETNDNAGALTAFVLIAILHETKSDPIRVRHESTLQRATDFLYSRVSSSTSPYEVAIGSYALHLADSQHKDLAYKKLMAMTKRDQDGLMHWSIRPDQEQNKTSDRLKVVASDYLLYPNAVDIEATSYAILTMALRSEIDQAIPAVRWLISKQNSNGGFSSTQDTVIGLQALGAIAERISTATVKMAVNIKHGNVKDGDLSTNPGPQQALYFNTDNALVLQQIQLDPEKTDWVQLEASGFGTAIIQVSYQYNLAVSAEKPAFFLNPQKDKTSTENYLQLSICTYYKEGNSTNMAVMEVELPSGYNADVDALPAATRAKEVKRVDTANNDGTVIVYLDRVTRDELCITVPAHRTHHVANNKPVPVTIYDYYDRSKLSRIFYEPNLVTFCDICPQNEIECRARCSQRQSHRQQRQRNDDSSRTGTTSFDRYGEREWEDGANHSLNLNGSSILIINAIIIAFSSTIFNFIHNP